MPKLPEKGSTREEILRKMEEAAVGDADWREARTWSLVYFAEEDILSVAKHAYNMFFSENALNPMAFPSLRKFENEVVAMTAHLLGGKEEAVGSMTSGGTESILLAVKTARDWAKKHKPRVTEPEMILPITAHPSFEKAGHYFGVKPIHIPIRSDLRADVKAAEKAITENTILIAGSAPCYPYGVIDPIEELAYLAKKHDILFHTDACLGGFVLPFLKKAGYPVSPFDLSVPGVTSISADIHKYGYAGKGASTIIYKNAALRKFQFYVYADWPGGVYASPTMLGTRPGGAIASAWAVMNFLGEEGYLRLAREAKEVTDKLAEGINAIDGLKVLGSPDATVLAFASERVNPFILGDEMEKKGWLLDRLQNPPALHMIVTPNHRKIVQPFLEDLAKTAAELGKLGPITPSGMAAVYGMIGTISDRKVADDLVISFLDEIFQTK